MPTAYTPNIPHPYGKEIEKRQGKNVKKKYVIDGYEGHACII